MKPQVAPSPRLAPRALTEETTTFVRKRAPTLYAIITIKLLKGALFVVLAITAYTLSDNDLPSELRHVLAVLHVDPARKFFVDLAKSLGHITENDLLWAAAGTFAYSLFSLVEGTGLILRVSWACWLAIGESAFFIPIELYDLVRHFSTVVLMILILNVGIVWYLFQNRNRLFRHHHHHH